MPSTKSFARSRPIDRAGAAAAGVAAQSTATRHPQVDAVRARRVRALDRYSVRAFGRAVRWLGSNGALACPIFAGGRLFAASPDSTPKGRDLRREARYRPRRVVGIKDGRRKAPLKLRPRPPCCFAVAPDPRLGAAWQG